MMARWPAILFLAVVFCGWGCQKRELPGTAANSAGTGSGAVAGGGGVAPIVSLGRTVPMPEIFGRGRSSVSKTPSPVTTGPGLSPEEQNFLRATNEARARQNLSTLRPNLALSELARNHAARMARLKQNGYELDGRSLPQEVEARFPEQSYAMALGSSQLLECPVILESWLKDPQIKEQLLDGEYQEAGIGVARDGTSGYFYYVEILQAPKR